MRNKILKSIILATLIISLVSVFSGCKPSDNQAVINSAGNIPTVEQGGNTVPSVKGVTPSESTYEICIGKSFSWLESNFGELKFEYYWEGGDHYSAKETDLIFGFQTGDVNDDAPCLAVNAPFKALFPELADGADSNGNITAEQISAFFDSTYEYSYDDIHDMCYTGMAYKHNEATGKTYSMFFYPESDGSCNTDSIVVVKPHSNS